MDNFSTSIAQSSPLNTETILISNMEAIARGVRARIEENAGYAKKITDETIKIARSLGIANTEIERWADYRRNHLTQEAAQINIIKDLVNKTFLIKILSPDK